MKTQREFIPLSFLIPSLGKMPRIYFLYWQAAQSGHRGARLRFQSFRQSLPKARLAEIEALFKITGSGTPRR